MEKPIGSSWVGGTHILRHMGCALNMGPIFHEKIPNYGSDFQNFPGFAMIRCVSVAKPYEMGTFLLKKSLNMGTIFEKNYPWTWVWVLSCRWHILDQSESETPPATFTEDCNLFKTFFQIFYLLMPWNQTINTEMIQINIVILFLLFL